MTALAWVKDEPFGVEFVEVELADDRLSAIGVAIGTDPMPYRLDYTLATQAGFVTARLDVTTRGGGWRRRLELRRDEAGAWSALADADGDALLTPPGGDVEAFADALDCDLGLSPLTNAMPVLRHGLLAGDGKSVDLRMAWVSVPDLGVHASDQRYTAVREDADGAIVRYETIGGTFTADLLFDRAGLVVDYPGLARRL